MSEPLVVILVFEYKYKAGKALSKLKNHIAYFYKQLWRATKNIWLTGFCDA